MADTTKPEGMMSAGILERLGQEPVRRLTLDIGQILLAPDQEDGNLWILVEGRLLLYADAIEDPPVVFVDEGSFVGGAALLGRPPASFVVAASVSRLIGVPCSDLPRLVREIDGLGMALLRMSAWRSEAEHRTVTAIRARARRAREIEACDAVTSLRKGPWFVQYLVDEIRRRAGRSDFAVLVIDVDDLDAFVERQGLAAETEVIRAVAGAMRAVVRPSDVIARIGNSTFAIALPETSEAVAVQIGERIRDAISREAIVVCGARLPYVTASLGVSMSGPDGEPGDLIARAAAAARRVHDQGGDAVAA